MKRFIRPVALTCHELHAAGDLAAAIRIRAGAHSFEGKDFNIVSSVCLDKTLFEALRGLDPEAGETPELGHRGVSMVLEPTGEPIKDTLCETEGLLYQDIDIAQCVEPKQLHDIVGYYNRFDVFHLDYAHAGEADHHRRCSEGAAAPGNFRRFS